ncbi:MAG: C-terminal binding protein [Acidimicrobiia bacterium]
MDTRQSRPTLAVLGTRFDDFEVERRVIGDVDIVSGPGRDQAEVLQIASGCDVILAGAVPIFDTITLEQLGCRGIVRLGVGVETIDLDAAERLGMWVCHVPDYGTEAVAIHTVSLVLASIRRIPMSDRRIRTATWGLGGLRPLHLPGSLTVGLVGYGRIGRRVGQLLSGLGFGPILVADPFLGPEADLEPGCELVGLEPLLAASDIVSLHTPPAGDGPLIGAAQLSLMKPGAVLINTARGALVDTGALIDALAGGAPAVAALDVFQPEPPDMAVFETVSDSVILTPHMAWYTEESELELRQKGAAEAKRIIEGSTPLHPVASPRLEPTR